MPVRHILLHRPSFLFDCFVKIGQLAKIFWANGLPPPLAKNSPYAYGDGCVFLVCVTRLSDIRDVAKIKQAKRK